MRLRVCRRPRRVSAIWLLSSRGRPDACQEVLDACVATGMTSPGIVYVDETVEPYRRLKVPKNWRVHYATQWGSLQASMSYVFRKYPDASHYGWLADDTMPRTTGWDKWLEAAAGPMGFSHANDLWHADDPVYRHEYIRGDDMSTGLCWGGDLVRTVGWWALPGVRQAGIDTAWTAMLGPLGLTRYLHDVVVEHKHYRTGKRLKDAGDSWVRDGVDYVQADINTRDRWVCSREFIETVVRVATAAAATPDRTWLTNALVDARCADAWWPGMPSVRVANVRREMERTVEELITDVFRAHANAQPSPLS